MLLKVIIFYIEVIIIFYFLENKKCIEMNTC